MKAITATKWLASTMVAMAAVSMPASAVSVGKPAPKFSATLIGGQTFDLSQAKGKVVIISFWATWCAPCRLEMPALDAYYKAHKADGLELIAVSMDDASQDKKVRFIASQYSFPVAFQRQAHVSGYGRVWHLPMAFVIDRSGVLRVDGGQGEWVFDAKKLEDTITPLLNSPH